MALFVPRVQIPLTYCIHYRYGPSLAPAESPTLVLKPGRKKMGENFVLKGPLSRKRDILLRTPPEVSHHAQVWPIRG